MHGGKNPLSGDVYVQGLWYTTVIATLATYRSHEIRIHPNLSEVNTGEHSLLSPTDANLLLSLFNLFGFAQSIV